MAIQFESSEVIDRPINKVFHFYAVEHVRNHPRWDSDIELWLDSDNPIEVGTVIRRRNKRSGTPVEGIMKVVEFESNRVVAMEIHDGPAVMYGRTTFYDSGAELRQFSTGTLRVIAADQRAGKSFRGDKTIA